MSEENNDQQQQEELDASKKALKTGAKMAANAFAGPAGGKAVEMASKSKLGDAVLNKGAQALNQNPAFGKIAKAANDSGALDGIDNASQDAVGSQLEKVQNNKIQNISKGDNTDVDDSPTSDNNISNENSGVINSDIINDKFGSTGANEDSETGSVFFDLVIDFVKKHKIEILVGAGKVLFDCLIIFVIFLAVFSISGVVIDFFSGIKDSLVGFFNPSDEEKMQEYYSTLERVKLEYKNKGICIDVNLINASLTFNIDAQNFADMTQEEGIDIEEVVNEDGTKSEVSVPYKKMIRQVELLAAMQVSNKVYGLDETYKNTTGSYCSSDSKNSELVTASNLSSFKGSAKDSSTPELIAENDDEGIFDFFKKKVDKEKNYAYYLYYPAFNSDGTCNENVPANELEVSINDRNESVFYWNLVNAFIPAYYGKDGEKYGLNLLPDDVNSAEYHSRVLEIANSIYDFYNTIGPDTCDLNLCVDTSLTSSNLCPNGIELVETDGTSSLIPFEQYVAGVVDHENDWHDGDNIENMKAQAIIARTYALKHTNNCTTSIKNSTTNQTYDDPSDNSYALRAAQETKGMVLTKDNQIFSTEYDAFCVIDNTGDYYTLSQKNQKIPKSWADSQSYIPSTYKNCLCNQSSDAPASCFNSKGTYLDGGHGRGLSQDGSRYLQSIGYTYDQILHFYYGDDAIITATEVGVGGVSICGTGGISPTGKFVSHTCNDELGKRTGRYSQFWITTPRIRTTSSSTALNDFNNPQCTWYAYGRAMLALHESAGMSPIQARDTMFNALLRNTGKSGNATDWFNLNLESKTFASSMDVTKPKPGSIIVWSGGNQGYGHVGFIEKVEYDSNGVAQYVWVTEGNPADCYYNRRDINYIRSYKNKKFVGYIYVIDDGG